MFTRLKLALFVAMLSAVLVPAAVARPMLSEADRPAPRECSSPTLTGPTSARVGESYTVTGCGFAPGSLVPLEITEAGGCCGAVNRVADSSGAFTYSGTVWAAGSYRVRASVRHRNRWRVAASWSFQAS